MSPPTRQPAPVPYPNDAGQVKCVYCTKLLDQRWCKSIGHNMTAISLLRKCPNFEMDRPRWREAQKIFAQDQRRFDAMRGITTSE